MKKINFVFLILLSLISGLFSCSKDEIIQADEFINLQISDGASRQFVLNTYIDVDTNGVNEHYLGAFYDTIDNNFIMLLGKPELSTQIFMLQMVFIINGNYYGALYNSKNRAGSLQYSKIANKTGEYYEGTIQASSVEKINIITREPLESNLMLSGTFRIKRKY